MIKLCIYLIYNIYIKIIKDYLLWKIVKLKNVKYNQLNLYLIKLIYFMILLILYNKWLCIKRNYKIK